MPSAFSEPGAYPPDRKLPGSPRQCSLPLVCRHPPEGHQIGARKGRARWNTILSQPYRRRVSTDRPNREGSQLAASLEGEPGPTPAGKTLPHSYPEARFRRERVRDLSNTNPARGHKEVRTIKCQSCLWSQRGTKVNGSHRGDNSLLRPTGIQIMTKNCSTLQAMAPTKYQNGSSDLLTSYREQPRSTRIVIAYPQPTFSAAKRTITLQTVLIDK